MKLAVGVDVGNNKCVVAISTDGVVDAVLNEEAKRETLTVVHFAGNHRLFGTACPTNDPNSTFPQLKRLLIDENLLPYNTTPDRDRTRRITVFYLNEERSFNAPEMLGMILGHVRRAAEKTAGSGISVCVIGVPSYFDSRQQKLLVDAAVIAGFDPLMLIHEGEATATEYGHYRTSSAAVNVVFVDIGHCDTQITVARFEDGEITFLGKASDPNLGGRDFDEVIFNHFFQMFNAQYGKEDFSLNGKAKLKLRMASEKAKKVLSVNRDAQVNIDYLTSDFDANGVITREEFEGLSSGLRERIVDKCREALDNAMLDGESVDSVELVGSGSRVPAISRDLAAFFNREMSRTLNGTECVARGCALVCEQLIAQRRAANKQIYSVSWSKWLRMLIFRGQENGNLRKLESYLSAACKQENELLKQDRVVERAKKARNNLKLQIYNIRNKVNKKMVRSASDENVYMKLDELEQWLYDEGEDLSEEEYQAKIRALKSSVEGSEYGAGINWEPSLKEDAIVGQRDNNDMGLGSQQKGASIMGEQKLCKMRAKHNIYSDKELSSNGSSQERVMSLMTEVPCGTGGSRFLQHETPSTSMCLDGDSRWDDGNNNGDGQAVHGPHLDSLGPMHEQQHSPNNGAGKPNRCPQKVTSETEDGDEMTGQQNANSSSNLNKSRDAIVGQPDNNDMGLGSRQKGASIMGEQKLCKMRHTLDISFFMHPAHRLKLAADSRGCEVCGEAEARAEGSYVCDPCGFYVHRSCAAVDPTVVDVAHPRHILHYVILRANPCLVCKNRCVKWRYYCGLCNVHLHKDCLGRSAGSSS